MENSKILLQRGMSALTEARVPMEHWSVGGGTVLAYFFNHRLSKDIDIFLDDGQYLGGLSPRLNSINEEALAYDEQSNFISLAYPEGKVDFIVAAQITKFAPCQYNFCGQNVLLEDPVEIVVKKLFHRGEFLLVRDIFDLVVVANSDRCGDLLTELSKMKEKICRIEMALRQREKEITGNAYSLRFNDAILDDRYLLNGREVEIYHRLLRQLLND